MTTKTKTNWRTVRLGDVASYISRGVAPRYVESDGLPVLNQRCIRDGKVSLGESRLTDKKAAFSEDKLLRRYDVLINSTGTGTLGRVAQYAGESLIATVDSHVTIVRPDAKLVDPIYLGYACKKLQPQFEAMAEGSSGQTELSRTRLKEEVEILLPELKEQKHVAEILSAFDEKIQNNNRIIKTLEEMAQAIFKEWFGSDAGENTILSAYVSHLKKQVVPSSSPEDVFWHYSIPAFDNKKLPSNESGGSILSNKYCVEPGTILFSKLNPTTPRIWPVIVASDNPICSTEFLVLKPVKEKYFAFVHAFLRYSTHIQNLANGVQGTSTSHQRLRPEDILLVEFPKPEEKKVAQYNELAYPMLLNIDSLIKENEKLAATRDLLLPRLMSGEIQV